MKRVRKPSTKAQRHGYYIDATNYIDEAMMQGYGLCYAVRMATPYNRRPDRYFLDIEFYPEIYMFGQRIDVYFWNRTDKGNEARMFALAMCIAMTE